MTHSLSPVSASSSLSWSALRLPLACAASPFSLPAAAFCSLCAALRRSAACLRCLLQHQKDDVKAQFEQASVKHFSAQHVLQLTGTLHESWFDKHEAQHAEKQEMQAQLKAVTIVMVPL